MSVFICKDFWIISCLFYIVNTVIYLQRKKKQKLRVNNQNNGDIDHVHKKAVKKLQAKLSVSVHSVIVSD